MGKDTFTKIRKVFAILLAVSILFSLTAMAVDAAFNMKISIPSDKEPKPGISGIPTSGPAPLEVTFTGYAESTSSPITSYEWDFGDNTPEVKGKTVKHTYVNPGTYDVTLTVTAQNGAKAEAPAKNYIVVTAAAPTPSNQGIEADFKTSPTYGYTGWAPLTVNFVDKSSSEVDDWYWDFGDGVTSTDKNPTHTYTTKGKYTVKLSVEAPNGGRATEVKDRYINVR